MGISVFIAGDIVPYGRTRELFTREQTTELFGEILQDIQRSDFRIANLEAPVKYGAATPIDKPGPNLMTTEETAAVIKKAGFDLVTLANNHFFDQGQQGVKDTIDACDKAGLKTVGGGCTLETARRVLYHTIAGKTIAIINACEHESSVATTEHGGSNPLDLIDIGNDIIEARHKADYVLVIIHGGIEHYHLPTPRMKKWYRHFVTLGADAVINHHQHCISGYELYKGRPIFYGLGNFNFDRISEYVRQDSWSKGYAVELELSENIGFRLIPYIQNGEKTGIKLRNYTDFEKETDALNIIIEDDRRLEEELYSYVHNNRKELFLPYLPINNRFLKAMYRRGLLKLKISREKAMRLSNKITCESHLDVYKTLFDYILKEK